MPGSFRIGQEMKLYYLKEADRALELPNAFAAITKSKLVDMTLLRDVTINGETGEADVSTRGGGGFRQFVPTLVDFSIESSLVYQPGQVDFEEWKTTWNLKRAIAIAVLDNDVTVSANVCRGFWFDGAITNFGQNEALEEGVTNDIRIRQTISTDITFELVSFTVP